MITEYPVGSILGGEEIDAVRRVIESGDALTRGKDVGLFEKEFAEYCGSKYAVSVSSCTSALKISAQLLNLKKGDEVIVQDNSFWALVTSLLERDVTIKCCDIEPDTLNIDVDHMESLITSKTKAVYLTHHGGNPANIVTVCDVAEENNIKLVEDAAHAVGSEYGHKKIGSFGDITCFSFSTLKNMTTLGEGGMITVNNPEMKEMIEGLRTCYPFGEKVKRNVQSLGQYNMPKSPAFLHMGDSWEYDWNRVDEYGSGHRMSTIQAAVGRVQLKKLDKMIEMRTNIAERYNDLIISLGFTPLFVDNRDKHSWHLYSFFTRKDINRDEFIRKAKENGLDIVIRFYPIHLGGIMRMKCHDIGECPVCEDVWFKKQLALPISPQISDKEIEMIEEILPKLVK